MRFSRILKKHGFEKKFINSSYFVYKIEGSYEVKAEVNYSTSVRNTKGMKDFGYSIVENHVIITDYSGSTTTIIDTNELNQFLFILNREKSVNDILYGND